MAKFIQKFSPSLSSKLNFFNNEVYKCLFVPVHSGNSCIEKILKYNDSKINYRYSKYSTDKDNKLYKIILNASGQKFIIEGKKNLSILRLVRNNEPDDIPGFGICKGMMSCSTCHLIFTKKDYDNITDPELDEEKDMLDLCDSVCETSRLGCIVTLNENLDGAEVIVPLMFKPKK